MRRIWFGVSEVTRAYGISSIECSRGELDEQTHYAQPASEREEQMLTVLYE